MGLTSEGLKYLLDGLDFTNKYVKVLDISYNKIDSTGMKYLHEHISRNKRLVTLVIHNNPIGNEGFVTISSLRSLRLLIDDKKELKLNNINIDNQSMTLLKHKIKFLDNCLTINLCDNVVDYEGFIPICKRSLKCSTYPFIKLNYKLWNSREFTNYIRYCRRKTKKSSAQDIDFSNMYIFDDIFLSEVKKIQFNYIDLSYDRISSNALQELIGHIHKDEGRHISIHNNNLNCKDNSYKGTKIICDNLEKFVINKSSLNVANIGMWKEGFAMLIRRLKHFIPLKEIDITGCILYEEYLQLMEEHKEVFDCLDKLTVSISGSIDVKVLKSFLQTFSSIGRIKINW